jgi:protein-S-isoprenylcysteine O-methyltransferase Ste14
MANQHEQKKPHHQRDDLAGEHVVGDAGQLVLACLFAATWIADTFFFKYTTFLNQHVPLGVRIPSGVVLLVLAAYLARTGMAIVFGEEREQHGVIREGVFNVVRHPIYLSEILLYLGFLMLSISLAAAAVWVVAIGFLHYISRYEERLLLARFGEAYEQYMREVPMWIPRWIPRSRPGDAPSDQEADCVVKLDFVVILCDNVIQVLGAGR